MKLSELGLNRYGYKEEQVNKDTDPVEMSKNSNLQYKRNTSEVEETSGGDANNVQPGTVIKDVIIIADQLNASVFGFVTPLGLGSAYMQAMSPTRISLFVGEDEIPFTTGPNIGDAFTKVTLYGSVIACPLPTVDEALPIIRAIPEPTKVGERGHFGDRLYFDDITFPKEVLIEKNGKDEIEHTMMIGLLMKAVKELTEKVDKLENEIALLKN